MNTPQPSPPSQPTLPLPLAILIVLVIAAASVMAYGAGYVQGTRNGYLSALDDVRRITSPFAGR